MPLFHAPIPPLQVITERQAELPMLHNCLPLAIYIFQTVMYRCQCYFPVRPTLSFPPHFYMSTLYIFISIPAGQIGSAVPFF